MDYQFASNNYVTARVQRFQGGWIVYMYVPRSHAPNVWYVLTGQGSDAKYWSFFTPGSFLGPDALAYRPTEHTPAPGCQRPDVEFGVIWQAMKDVLGWAVEGKKSYETAVTYELAQMPYITPTRLAGPDGIEFEFHPNGAWEVVEAEKSLFAA